MHDMDDTDRAHARMAQSSNSYATVEMNDLHPSILIDTRHGIPNTKTQVDRIVAWVWRDAHARVAARLAKEPHKFDRREPMPSSRHAKDDACTITSQPGD